MPLARLSVPAHLSQAHITALANAVQAGLVATCGVPPDDCFQLIHRFPAGDMLLNPSFPGVSRTANASIVEVTFLLGRSDAQKRALYQAVVQKTSAAGFSPDDIMITLTENAAIDWSMGRGLAFTGHSE